MNAFDILGAVVQAGLPQKSGDRLGNLLGQVLGGALSGGTPGAAQATPGGGLVDLVTRMAGGMLGGSQGGMPAGMPAGPMGQGSAPGPGGAGAFPVDLLKQMAGAVLGGKSPQGNAGAGVGSMALFGMLAAQAIELAKGALGGSVAQAATHPLMGLDHVTAVQAGLQPPRTPEEQQQAVDVATLTLKAMISAAKADGQIDDEEQQRLIGKLGEGGISAEEQQFVAEEMRRPLDLDALAKAVPNQQVAAQLYTASLLAINVDTDAERRYLADLSGRLGLDPQVVSFLNKTVGIA